MKSVKQIAFAALLTMGAFGAVTLVSCSKDDDPVVCPEGMEGKDCTTEMREKFVAPWTAKDELTDGSSELNYTAIISKNSTSITKLNITGFSKAFYVEDVIVNVNTSETVKFSIPAQDPDGDGYTVEGSGTLNTTTNTIAVEYKITQTSDGQVKSYTGTWKK